MLTPETKRPHTTIHSWTERKNVFLLSFQIRCELESVIAHESTQCANPNIALRILPDVLGEHLRKTVLCGVMAMSVFRSDSDRLCSSHGTILHQERQHDEQTKQNVTFRIHAGWDIYKGFACKYILFRRLFQSSYKPLQKNTRSCTPVLRSCKRGCRSCNTLS